MATRSSLLFLRLHPPRDATLSRYISHEKESWELQDIGMKDRWTVKGISCIKVQLLDSHVAAIFHQFRSLCLTSQEHFPPRKRDTRNPFARTTPSFCAPIFSHVTLRPRVVMHCYLPWLNRCVDHRWRWPKQNGTLQNEHIPHSGERKRPGRWLLRSRTAKSIYRIYLIGWWGGQNVRSMRIIAKRDTSAGGCCNSSTSMHIHRWGLDWKGRGRERAREKDGEKQRGG